MQQILLDEGRAVALILIKMLPNRLMEQMNKGMKSHIEK